MVWTYHEKTRVSFNIILTPIIVKTEKYSKRRYDKNCLKVAKEIVRIRDKLICQRCWSTKTPQCSHILSDWKDTRMSVDPDNMKILCYSCHIHWRHKEPLKAYEWFIEKFPWRYEMLKERQLNQEEGSISLTWRENKYIYLQNLLDDIKKWKQY